MTGLPNEDYRLTVNSSANWTTREVIIDDVTRDWNIIVYNTTALKDNNNNTTTRLFNETFTLNDRTGQYDPADTTLAIQDYINGSWTTIAGGQFGAENQVTAALLDGSTYRIRISSGQNSRELGRVIPRDDNTPIILDVQKVNILPPEDISGAFAGTATILSNDQGAFIRFRYRDTADKTSSITWKVTKEDESGTTIIQPNKTVLGTYGKYTASVPINQKDGTYIVEWWVVRNGTTYHGQTIVGGVRNVCSSLPLDPNWLGILSVVSIGLVAGLFVSFAPRIGAFSTFGFALLLTQLGCLHIPSWSLVTAGGTAMLAIVGRASGVGP
jgi:hypothetical protein